MHYAIRIGCCKMTGMYQCRNIVSPGTINFGTRGPRTFVRGHIVSGRPVTPPHHLLSYKKEARSSSIEGSYPVILTDFSIIDPFTPHRTPVIPFTRYRKPVNPLKHADYSSLLSYLLAYDIILDVSDVLLLMCRWTVPTILTCSPFSYRNVTRQVLG